MWRLASDGVALAGSRHWFPFLYEGRKEEFPAQDVVLAACDYLTACYRRKLAWALLALVWSGLAVVQCGTLHCRRATCGPRRRKWDLRLDEQTTFYPRV